MSLWKLQRAVREERFEFTGHALDEMDEDNLLIEDVLNAILTGNIVAELKDDPRGTRFVVCGTSEDTDCKIEVVCRFLPSGLMRIITVYCPE